MKIVVYLNGSVNVDEHISIYVTLLEGKNDSQLNWPFVGSITITLLNQLADRSHFKKLIQLDREKDLRPKKSLGYPKFIAHSDLSRPYTTQYLMDDTLYFKVSIENPRSKPWLEWT